MGRGVDEVGEGNEGSGQADDRPIEADDEDLGVGGEGVGDVEIEGCEGLEPVPVYVGAACWRAFGEGNVGTSIGLLASVRQFLSFSGLYIRSHLVNPTS